VSAALLLLAALLLRPCLWAQDSKDQAPSFSSDSIVNSANGSSTSLTPSAIASIYGLRLAFDTQQVSLAQIGPGSLPTTLQGARITIGGRLCSLLYVSPIQINFVIPADLPPGRAILVLDRQSTSLQVQITLLEAAPGLYVVENGKLAAEHADGKLITAENPALPSEIIVVFGTGLGRTDPRQMDGLIPRAAARALVTDRLRVLLDGQILPNESVLYAGITPGFPGLYQVNVRLPDRIIKSQPELRVSVDEQISQSALLLPVAPSVDVNH
jgi:uncharacterized protein (TIGR03437 family)